MLWDNILTLLCKKGVWRINIEKLSKPIYIVKGLSEDYYHVTTDNTANGEDVLFSSDNGIELLSFVTGYNINAQIKINEDELENLITELS